MSYFYTKLSASITDSTIWREPHATRIVWITMLAMADKRGRVFASIPGLADRARVTFEECESALKSFLSPDPYSRTPDYEGRRIERIDGGWRLFNYEKHRNAVDEEHRRERDARNSAAYRARKKESSEPSEVVRGCQTITETETETETEKTKTSTTTEASASASPVSSPKAKAKGKAEPDESLELPDWLNRDSWNGYVEMRKGMGKKGEATPYALRLILKQLAKGYEDGYDANAVLEKSILNNWRGVFFNEESPKRKRVRVPMSLEEVRHMQAPNLFPSPGKESSGARPVVLAKVP